MCEDRRDFELTGYLGNLTEEEVVETIFSCLNDDELIQLCRVQYKMETETAVTKEELKEVVQDMSTERINEILYEFY